MAHRDKLAVNPLPWVIGPDGFTLNEATLTAALTDLRDAGFDAVHADIPADWDVARYREFLDGFGFRPAPGYFSADFSNPDEHSSIAEAAKRHASQLAELGLTETFTASNLAADRLEYPASGHAPDADRTAVVADGLARAAEAAKAEGVVHALHPHVGSHVEVEAEVRQVLDATNGSALAFGPDTGHLFWAGVTPEQIIADYADRVVAIHLKDVDVDAARAAHDAEADYWAATGNHHVWTEPGRGSVRFDRVFAALPATFAGWSVLEVDVPNVGTGKESASLSRRNLLAMPFFAAEETEQA